MRTSFVLLATDEARLLEHSLPAAAAELPDQLLVIDNGSSDDCEQVARRLGADCLRLDPRRSYAQAMNASIAAADGDAVALLQADCFVTPGFRERAVGRLGDPSVAAVAPKLLRTLGPDPQDRLAEVDAAAMVIDRRRKNSLVGHGAPAAGYTASAECFGADGAGAVYRRAALRDCALGGEVFDPDLERWASDADLAWRARVLGWRSVYEPSAVAYHMRTYKPSTRRQMSEESRRMQFRNRYLMMIKNDSLRELAPDLAWVAAYEGLALGHALLRERHLLHAYPELWRLLPAARRRRSSIQARRRVGRVPFGLRPPAAPGDGLGRPR